MESNKYLEQVLSKISISPQREKHIKSIVERIYKELIKVDKNCYNYRFGGSFKRYTSIRNYFDVDVYFIGHFPEHNLLNYFNSKLKSLEKSFKPFEIARKPPYLHAIPAIFNSDIELDCIGAIRLNDKNEYKIPEGKDVIIINPELNEEKLKELNRRNPGMGTKLIRLLKKWNALHNKPFKSYQIEALTFKIFKDKKIKGLDKGLKTFFTFGINFLQNGKEIFDDLDKHPILKGVKRKCVVKLMKETLQLMNKSQWTKVFPTI